VARVTGTTVSAIAGGEGNTASGALASVGGGAVNNADSTVSVLLGLGDGTFGATTDAPVGDLRQMKGDQSLEDIFLELTGGNDVDAMVKELGDEQ